AQLLADVALRALPGGHGVVHAAVRWVVVHESLAQLATHVVHRGRVIGEQLEEAYPFVSAVAGGEGHAHHDFLTVVVGPVVELEVPALLGPPYAPAGENSRDVDHVLLSVGTVHAECVQLEQLASVILVDALRHAFHGPLPLRVRAHRVARWVEPRRTAEAGGAAEHRPGPESH